MPETEEDRVARHEEQQDENAAQFLALSQAEYRNIRTQVAAVIGSGRPLSRDETYRSAELLMDAGLIDPKAFL